MIENKGAYRNSAVWGLMGPEVEEHGWDIPGTLYIEGTDAGTDGEDVALTIQDVDEAVWDRLAGRGLVTGEYGDFLRRGARTRRDTLGYALACRSDAVPTAFNVPGQQWHPHEGCAFDVGSPDGGGHYHGNLIVHWLGFNDDLVAYAPFTAGYWSIMELDCWADGQPLLDGPIPERFSVGLED